jgi:phospholipid/cholesterol/gamma-HCH transport system permease protein
MNPLMKAIDGIGSGVILLFSSLRYLPTLVRQSHRFLDHCFHIGYASLPIVGVMSFFIGAVLALQSGYSLSEIKGANEFLGSIVGLAMCRELGPVMTAFLLAGRVGSAITAELASMKVYNEIEALQTMNIPPERMLVMPRLAAIFFMMPILTLTSIVVGWYGGMLVASNVGMIDLDPGIYWRSLKTLVSFDDVVDGLVKAEVFGLAVVLICCNTGLRTTGGPREVGNAVTRAVVAAMISILLLDYAVTRILI